MSLLSLREPTSSGQPLKLRWINFTVCPHCLTNNRPAVLERVNKESPIISRSDGLNFHLVLGSQPIGYPPRRPGGRGYCSAGFWYVHEGPQVSSEIVVVLVRDRFLTERSLLQILNFAADELYEKLERTGILDGAYEFEGGRLHRVS